VGGCAGGKAGGPGHAVFWFAGNGFGMFLEVSKVLMIIVV
jgi:hypothetical protein